MSKVSSAIFATSLVAIAALSSVSLSHRADAQPPEDPAPKGPWTRFPAPVGFFCMIELPCGPGSVCCDVSNNE